MGKNKYEATKGASFTQEKAQIYGEYLEQLIEGAGKQIATSEIVDAARDRQSPIHECFEWNDTIAGEKYRKHQARNLVNHIVKVNFVDDQIKEKAFYHIKVTTEEEGKQKLDPVYMSQERVLSMAEFRRQTLNSAITQIEHWEKRYISFKELNIIFAAIAATRKEIEAELSKKEDGGRLGS